MGAESESGFMGLAVQWSNMCSESKLNLAQFSLNRLQHFCKELLGFGHFSNLRS